ncbi:MAG: sugar phosphate isomerase/epimerase [Pseudomonadota bacterium]
MDKIIRNVQVNIPFAMLHDSYLPRFLENGLNPEVGFDAHTLDRFSPDDFRSVAERILETGLSITMHAPFMDLSAGSPDREVRALTKHRFQQFVQLIPLFRPKAVVCHTGWDEKRYWALREPWLHNSLEIWLWMEERVRKEEAVLVLENVYEQDPDDLLELLDNLKGARVGFCLDTGHQAVFSKAGLPTWLEKMEGYIVQLHLHDNHGLYDEHLALGEGTIDFPALFRHFKSKNISQPIITLEPHGEQDLWPSLEYLQQIWPW